MALIAASSLALASVAGWGAWRYGKQIAQDEPGSIWPLVVMYNGKCGAVDQTGGFVIPAQFDGLRGFGSQQLVGFKQGTLWGFLDRTGKIVIPAQFDDIGPFTANGLALAKTGSNWGYIDRTGKFVIQPQFELAFSFMDNDRAWAETAGKFGLIDTSGKFAVQPQFSRPGLEFVSKYQLGIAPVVQDGGVGAIDVDGTGNMLIPARFEALGPFSADGIALAAMERKWGLIDHTGTFVVSPAYELRNLFIDDELIPVTQNSRTGFIDHKGEVRIPFMFDDAGSFSGGPLAPAKQSNGNWGFIDRTGRFVVAPQFADAKQFENGHAVVRKGDLWGIIDADGQFTVPPGYLALIPPPPKALRDLLAFRPPDIIAAEDASGHWGVFSEAVWERRRNEAGQPGSGVIPEGCDTCSGATDVDPDRPRAA